MSGVHLSMTVILSWGVCLCMVSGILCGKRALSGVVSLGAVRVVGVCRVVCVVCVGIDRVLRGMVRANRMVSGDASVRYGDLLRLYHIAVPYVHRRAAPGVCITSRCNVRLCTRCRGG